MRRDYFGLIRLAGLCGLLCLSGCQNQAKVEVEPAAVSAEAVQEDSAGSPRIVLAKSEQDFGEVSPNKLYTADVKFTNTGDGTLNISKLSRCCGVVAELAAGKMRYAPGESGAVHIEWRSGSQPMVFTRELIIHSDDPGNPAAKLKIQAKIALKVTWEPKRLRLMFDEDNAGCPEITISCLDERPFAITSFKSTGDCITADFDPSVEATQFVLQPKVDMEKLHKNLKGRIILGLTHPDGNSAVILFDVTPQYTINPPLLIMFEAEPGKPIVRKISVLNNYKKDFEIDSLSSTSGAVEVKVLSKRKLTYGYQLEVELTPPPSEGKMKFLDEFKLTLDNGEELPIRCNGYYKKAKPVTTIR